MIKKIKYSWQQIEGQVLDIARSINTSKWSPSYIVGLDRGGLTPAVMLSHYLGIPHKTLRVSLRDSSALESNLWMAEDAYDQTNILIVDDINDQGSTINWIMQDWQSSCCPGDDRWKTVWHNSVKFAVLTNNLASSAEVDYSACEINKAEEDVWIVYPWEEFWVR